jgi:type I restriction enzyme S subunit
MSIDRSTRATLVSDKSMPWIGEYPGEWTPTPLRALLKRKSSRVGRNFNNFDLLSLTLNGVIKRNLEGMKGKFPTSFETYQEVKPGDFIFCLFDVEETPRAVGLSTISGMITGAYTVYEPKGAIDSEFLSRVLHYCDEKKRFKTLYRGLRNTISKSSFEAIKIPVPKIQDQLLINRYLDHSEISLSNAINGKKELLKLLQERKESIINSKIIPLEITSSKATDSGIKGIDQIPENWQIVKLKNVVKSRDVRSTTGKETKLSVSAAHGVVERARHAVTMFEAASYVGHKIVQPGDLVVNSLWAWARGLGVANDHGLVSPVYGVYEVKKINTVNLSYLHLVMRSNRMQWQLQLASRGIWRSRYTITPEAFLNLQIPLPPISEQEDIVREINVATRDTEKALQSLRQEIELLIEYKSSLFAEVITGRKNVTELASKLPDLSPDAKAKLQSGVSNLAIEEIMEMEDE